MPVAWPIPPIQSLAPWQLAAAGVSAVVVGAAALLWGRILHRVLLMATGAGLGYWLASALADRFAIRLVLMQAGCILALAAAGLMLARVIWALLGAAVAAAIAVLAIVPGQLANLGHDPWPVFMPAETLEGWAAEASRCVLASLAVMWEHQPALMAITAGVAASVPLVVFLLRGRIGAIIMTALTGGAAIVAGLLTACSAASASLPETARDHWYVPAGLLAVLTVSGLVIQCRAALAADKAAKAKKQADKDESKPSEKAEKKKS